MYLSFFTLLPSMFLSGFLFPVEAMPRALQLVSNVIPLRYMSAVAGGIILKGVGLPVLISEVVTIALFGAIIFGVAVRRFHKRLE